MSQEPEYGHLLARHGFAAFMMGVVKEHIKEEDIAAGALESISAMLSPETAKKIDALIKDKEDGTNIGLATLIGFAKTLYDEFSESEQTQVAVLNFFQSLSMCGKTSISIL